jgi:FecR-like protein
MRKLIIVLLAIFASALPAIALAQGIASAVGVRQSATLESGGTSSTLKIGDALGVGDIITTGASGQVQIEFTDGTKMVVGNDSTLVIEEYLLRNATTVSQFAVNALNGTFRFISGGSPSEAYTINTPNGTIGVRGTAFDFTVGDFTIVIQFEGTSQLCAGDECVDLVKACLIGQSRFGVDEASLIDQVDNNGVIRAGFPYVISQFPLLRSFRIDAATTCFIRRSDSGSITTLNDDAPEMKEEECEYYDESRAGSPSEGECDD